MVICSHGNRVLTVHNLKLGSGMVGEDVAHTQDFAVEMHHRRHVVDDEAEMVHCITKGSVICWAIITENKGVRRGTFHHRYAGMRRRNEKGRCHGQEGIELRK